MKTVRKLEKRIEKTVLEVISDMGLKRFPLLRSQQTRNGTNGCRRRAVAISSGP